MHQIVDETLDSGLG